MVWPGIIGDELLGPFQSSWRRQADKPVTYCIFKWAFDAMARTPSIGSPPHLDVHARQCPSHAAKATRTFLGSICITGNNLMTLPPCSPDLNPIEQLWSILKTQFFERGVQFLSKDVVTQLQRPQRIESSSLGDTTTHYVYYNCQWMRKLMKFMTLIIIKKHP